MAPNTFITALSLLVASSHAAVTITSAAAAPSAAATSVFAAAASSGASAVSYTGPTSIVSMFLDGDSSNGGIVASVVSANPSVTQYFITCAPDVDGSDCGWGPGAQVTVSDKSIFTVSIDGGTDFNFQEACTVFSTDSVVCTAIAAGSQANDPGTSIQTLTGTDVAMTPVTVTAGLDLLSAAATATASGSKSASAKNSATAKKTTATGGGSATATAPSAGSAPERIQAWSAVALLTVAAVMVSL